MPAEIHIADGLLIKATIRDEDGAIVTTVGSATTKEIWLTKPDGTVLTKTASLFTDGSDGIIKYQCANSDLDIAGIWSVQGYIVIGGYNYHSNIETFKVYRNLQ